MELPAAKWYRAISRRHSRRKYKNTALEDKEFQMLSGLCHQLNEAMVNVRAVPVRRGFNEVSRNILGSYGMIRGANSYVAFVGQEGDYRVNEKIGYLGEAVILEATSMGLGSCWVGGFFDPDQVKKHIQLQDKERLFAIAALGYVDEQKSLGEKIISFLFSSHKRKDLDELCMGGYDQSWPKWIKKAIKAARLAPSSLNRQPWLFTVKDQAITVSVGEYGDLEDFDSKKLDCGVAMLHLELAALDSGVEGDWKLEERPEVATFTAE